MQTTIVVHPSFHSFHSDFCRCLAPSRRLAFLSETPRDWLDHTGYNQDAPDASVFVACVEAPDAALFKEWVVFPCAIAVLLLICGTQMGKVKSIFFRYTESTSHKKQQHDPGYLILDGNKVTERSKADTKWCDAAAPIALPD